MLDSCDRVGDSRGDGDAADSKDDVDCPSLDTGTCQALRAVLPTVAGLYPSIKAFPPSNLLSLSLIFFLSMFFMFFMFLLRLFIE